MNKYKIAFQGLSEGKHEFKFDVNDKFFENLDYSDIKKGELLTNVLLNKRPQFLELAFNIKGFVVLMCDRCLDDYRQEIDYNGVLFVKFSEKYEGLSEDVIYLSPTEYELDIRHYIYESIKLSIPLKSVHPENEDGSFSCNPEMLKKLSKYIKDHPVDGGYDPRWNDLEKLMGNNN